MAWAHHPVGLGQRVAHRLVGQDHLRAVLYRQAGQIRAALGVGRNRHHLRSQLPQHLRGVRERPHLTGAAVPTLAAAAAAVAFGEGCEAVGVAVGRGDLGERVALSPRPAPPASPRESLRTTGNGHREWRRHRRPRGPARPPAGRAAPRRRWWAGRRRPGARGAGSGGGRPGVASAAWRRPAAAARRGGAPHGAESDTRPRPTAYVRSTRVHARPTAGGARCSPCAGRAEV